MFTPLAISELEKFLDKIERLKSTFNLALAADSASALVRILEAQRTAGGDIRDIKDELNRKRELETRVTLDKMRLKIVKFFRPVDPMINHETSLKLKHPETGRWLYQDETYLNWKSGIEPHLWIFGIPWCRQNRFDCIHNPRCDSRLRQK
jgi:hypothetical protein